MPKTKKAKCPTKQPRRFYAAHPWQCQHHPDRSEIKAYIEASGEWETILTVHATSGASAEELATYVASIVNEHQGKADLLDEAAAAEAAPLSWPTWRWKMVTSASRMAAVWSPSQA